MNLKLTDFTDLCVCAYVSCVLEQSDVFRLQVVSKLHTEFFMFRLIFMPVYFFDCLLLLCCVCCLCCVFMPEY